MSDNFTIYLPHETGSGSLDEPVDKDRTSQLLLERTSVTKVQDLGTDNSATSSQETDKGHYGVFASAQNAIHSATDTIKYFLRESCLVAFDS
jgi:hypothetical protein